MDAIEIAGAVGELLAWIGLGFGIPLLLVALIAALVQGEYEPTEIVLVPNGPGTTARWFAGGDFHERTLAEWEAERVAAQEAYPAFVSRRDPSRMRLEPSSTGRRIVGLLGRILVAAGLVGFAASWLPAFVG